MFKIRILLNTSGQPVRNPYKFLPRIEGTTAPEARPGITLAGQAFGRLGHGGLLWWGRGWMRADWLRLIRWNVDRLRPGDAAIHYAL